MAKVKELLINTRTDQHSKHILSVPWRDLSRENVPIMVSVFKRIWGIRSKNGLGYLFRKNCHPFEQLGPSIGKKMSSIRAAWAIHLKTLLSV